MRYELRPTFNRIRVLQFLDGQDLSKVRALSAADIGEQACPQKISNARAWGSSQIRSLRQHALVERAGRNARGHDTWVITRKGEDYLINHADIIAYNHWHSPWPRSQTCMVRKIVNEA